jgi:hypothetical protein
VTFAWIKAMEQESRTAACGEPTLVPRRDQRSISLQTDLASENTPSISDRRSSGVNENFQALAGLSKDFSQIDGILSIAKGRSQQIARCHGGFQAHLPGRIPAKVSVSGNDFWAIFS